MDICLMGPGKSGKTSLQKVVFQKMSAHETLYLEATTKMETIPVGNNDFLKFNVRDFPHKVQLDNLGSTEMSYFQNCGAIIFVLDAQIMPYEGACSYLKDIIAAVRKIKENIFFEVFIHKVDGDLFLTDDHKLDTQKEIQLTLKRELQDAGIDINPSYYLTSIYDHSIYEAFGKVIKKLLPQVSYLEHFLDNLLSNCKMEKVFLFDVVNKICLASDTNPADLQHFAIASDMIDLFIDVSCIYGINSEADGLTFDEESSSVIKLTSQNDNNTLLYLKEVEKCLGLVCFINEKEFAKKHLINYNIDCFKKGLREIFETFKKASSNKY